MSRRKILLVDDQRTNHFVFKAILEDSYQLISAKNAEECLNKARMEMPDLILLDIVMPGMDGFDCLKNLKSQDQTKAIPVVMVSSLESEKEKNKARELGAADYITKPINSTNFRNSVEKYAQPE